MVRHYAKTPTHSALSLRSVRFLLISGIHFADMILLWRSVIALATKATDSKDRWTQYEWTLMLKR